MKIVNIIGVIAVVFSSMGAMAASLMSVDANKLQSVPEGEELSKLQGVIDDATAAANKLEQDVDKAKQGVAAAELQVVAAENAINALKMKVSEKGLEPTTKSQYNIAIRMSQIDLETAIDNKKTVEAFLIAAEAKYKGAKKTLRAYQAKLVGSGESCVPGRDDKILCRAIKEPETDEKTGETKHVEAFADLGLSPTLADGGEIKLGLLRGFVDLGENFKAPFFVAIADVTSQTEPGEANTTKLLDPDQGVNIGQEYVWRYHFFGLCAGKNTTADCRLGFNWGARYMKLQGEGEEESKGTFGAFSTAQTAWSFNIFDIDNPGIKLGTIRLYAAYSQFFHDGKNSSDYFAGVTDDDGNPVSFDKNFGSFKYGASIYINESINISYSKFNAVGADGVNDNESYTLNFDVLKF